MNWSKIKLDLLVKYYDRSKNAFTNIKASALWYSITDHMKERKVFTWQAFQSYCAWNTDRPKRIQESLDYIGKLTEEDTYTLSNKQWVSRAYKYYKTKYLN